MLENSMRGYDSNPLFRLGNWLETSSLKIIPTFLLGIIDFNNYC
jgi:hypothetical protein